MESSPVSLDVPVRRTIWPTEGLDVKELLRRGWEPLPFTEFVVKIHSRCNLACDYCYVYEMADQSWRDQPKTMSRKVFNDAIRTIVDHVRRFRTPVVNLIFHGGEPLMVGHHEFEYFARYAREALEPIATVRLGVQTNGVLLDQQFLHICTRWNVRIGVSLDGDENGNDSHRRDRRGVGSYARVTAGIEQLRAGDHRDLFAGLLCTIDVANNPLQTYEALIRFNPPAVDFLLPHANWDARPPASTVGDAATPYADWLIAVFDRWFQAPSLETQVRIFDDIIHLLMGGSVESEGIGLAPVRLAVIETDGTVEQVDELKSAFAGATRLRTTTTGNPLDIALLEPAIAARQIGVKALCDTCQECPLHPVCGGGHYVHRYRGENGFRNPSVYCADLAKLIQHIDSRVRADLMSAVSTTHETYLAGPATRSTDKESNEC